MSPRGVGIEGGIKSTKAKILSFGIAGLLVLVTVFIIVLVYNQQSQTEDSLATVLKGSVGDWCVIVDCFPYVRLTDSRGERWFRVIATDDTALYISKLASIAVTKDGKEMWVRVRYTSAVYETRERFLERFSGKCGEKMLEFCKRYKLPFGRIKEVCCGD